MSLRERTLNSRHRTERPKCLWQIAIGFILSFFYLAVGLPSQTLEAATLSTPKSSSTRTYSKEDLQLQIPENPVTPFGSYLASELREFLADLTSSQIGSQKAQLYQDVQTDEPSGFEARLSVAARRRVPTSDQADTEKLRVHVQGEIQSLVKSRIKSQLKLLESLQGGVDFSFNLLDLLPGRGIASGPVDQPLSRSKGRVRYGLILKGIKPDPNAPMQVAVDRDFNLEARGKADITWTIGPLENAAGSQKTTLFNVESPFIEDLESSVGLWDKVLSKLPKPEFRGRLSPVNVDGWLSDSAAAQPDWLLDLEQIDGFYKLTYQTNSDFKKAAGEHLFQLPIRENATVVRRLDSNFETIATSAENLRLLAFGPSLDLHHYTTEERFAGHLRHAYLGHSVSLSYRGRATGKLTDESSRPIQYGLEYRTAL